MNLYFISKQLEYVLEKTENVEKWIMILDKKAKMLDEKMSKVCADVEQMTKGRQEEELRLTKEADYERKEEQYRKTIEKYKFELEDANQLLEKARSQYQELSEMTAQVQEEGRKWRAKYLRIKREADEKRSMNE